MVTPTNQHAIAAPNLHGAEPLALRRFSQHLMLNKGEDQKKSYDLSPGPVAGSALYYGKSGPG